MDVASGLVRLLKEMGNNADEVAETLRRGGVQGVRNAVRLLNPVVRYVQNAMRLDSLDMNIMTGHSIRTANGKIEVQLPDAVKDFLQAFNQGAFPDLELPSTEI